jgi:hypothetical protein
LCIAGETLPNGIVLPDQWPPKRTLAELRAGEPMALPYLKNPPAVIPIDVGRQLLVDDFLIEQATLLTRRFHQAQYYSGNPIVRPDQPWEKEATEYLKRFPSLAGVGAAMTFSDGAFYDPQDKLFKLWYMSGGCGDTAYAFSKDGLRWIKPELDVKPGTNIVIVSGGARDSTTIWLDLDTKDPSQRYKAFQFIRPQGLVYTSPDGIHWSAPTRRRGTTTC